MEKSKLVVPCIRSGLLSLRKLCTLIFLISFAISSFLTAQQPSRTVTGTIMDSKGEPVIGASVLVKGTTIGINTDLNGNFQVNLPAGSNTLVVSFVGMKTQEVDIAGKTSISVKLTEESLSLDEVVVVGYGVQKKMTVTGAVATVKSQDLLATPVSQVSTALIGRSAGLLSAQRTGEPGEDAATLRIRGIGTFSGSQDPLIMVDGIESNSYNNIDPNEIESVTVLKDASATAVYGVRGANGVLLITTKRGKVGKPQVSYSANFASNQFAGLRKRMNAYDYASSWQLARKYDSYLTGAYAQLFTDDDLQKYKDHSDPIFHPDADWMSIMLKDVSYQNQQNLNIRGGTEGVKYFISAGLFHQGGLFNNTKLIPDYFDMQTVYNRYNFRSNFDFKITEKLSASVDVSTQIGNKNGLNNDDASSILRLISISNPISVPGLYQGMPLSVQSPVAGSNNPLTNFYGTGYAKKYTNNLNGSIRLNYDLSAITKGLTVHALTSYRNYNVHTINFYKSLLTYTALGRDPKTNEPIIVPNNDDGPVSMGESVAKNRQTYSEFGLDYARRFGDHNFTAKIMYNQGKTFDPNFQYVIPKGIQGLVGRVSYDYKGRYMAEFNMGYNGTENFAKGKRFGFFPAYSVGWVASDENFFPKNNIVTFLKFRGSYGEVGNDQIGGDRFLYNPSAYTILNGNGNASPSAAAYNFGLTGISASPYFGAREQKMGNAGVTWERAKKTDLGFEIKLFKDKFSLSADYFKERRDNILSAYGTIPEISGVLPILPAVNLGKMKNEGFDGEVSLNLKTGEFNYFIKGNFSYAHNTILFRDEVFTPYPYQMSTGQSYGQLRGYIAYDLYNTWDQVTEAYRPKTSAQNNLIQPGDPNFKDVNGDGVIDQFDSGPIGYSDFPEIIYGINLGGDYKGLDFSFLFQGAGHVTFSASDNYVNHFNAFSGVPEYFLNSWTNEKYLNGELITFPRLFVNGGGTSTAGYSSRYYYVNAAYLRLRNAEIGYTIKENGIFRLVGISNARIYLNGSNLLTYAPKMQRSYPGVDPEDQGNYKGDSNREPYPRTRVFNVGVNINF